jgi:dGTP triphosphohydrolase
MATVGYGDYVPETHIGRVIAVLACVWGNFLISLMVVSLTISSEFNPSQRKAYDNIMKEIGLFDHNKKAMRVVQSLLMYNLLSKKKKLTREDKLKHLNIIRDRIKDFQQHRKKLFVKD